MTRGTPEATAMLVTSRSKLIPLKARKPWNITACSSAVRSAWVAMRQWSTRPSAADPASVTDVS